MKTCVFCNFDNFQVRTVGIAHNIYIVATLGQITNGGYLLLIPTKHSPCIASMNKGAVVDLQEVLSETLELLEAEYEQPVTFFEHGIIGQSIKHSHLHLLPAEFNLTPKIKTDFPNSKIQPIENLNHLRLLYRKKPQPYLLWSTPKNETLVCWNPPAQPEYLRILAANLLNVPERGKWREMDPKLDKKLIDETLDKLATSFIV